MTENTTPAKRKSNPNFGKRDENGNLLISSASKKNENHVVSASKVRESLGEIWASFYAAILSTYNTPGPAVVAAAAKTADDALVEYKKRF